MNLILLAWAYIRHRALNSALNILLMSFGIATITVLLLLTVQLERALYKNAEGFDVVVGAKGSPIQLILSGIYHVDSPTGNIPMDEARELMGSRFVKSSIPLALGDNWEGYRIVGTAPDYLEHFGVTFADGHLWNYAFDVVIGADVARETGKGHGDTILSAHGLTEGGMEHPDHAMIITGVLAPSGTALDQLVLTSVETMWGIHDYGGKFEATARERMARIGGEQAAGGAMSGEDTKAAGGAMSGDGHAHGDAHEVEDAHDHAHGDEDAHGHVHSDIVVTRDSYLDPVYDDKDLTVLLMSYANPLAAAQFPRYVNTQTSMQAAAPAFEITRLLNVLGVGLDAVRFFGWVLVFSSALGLFIALLNSMKERVYDLAVMRVLGGGRLKLVALVLLEGLLLSAAGGLLGIGLAHVGLGLISRAFAQARSFTIDGAVFVQEEFYIFALAIAIGLVSSLIPALMAYRTQIVNTLSKG